MKQLVFKEGTFINREDTTGSKVGKKQLKMGDGEGKIEEGWGMTKISLKN